MSKPKYTPGPWWVAGEKEGEYRPLYPAIRGQFDATTRITICRVGSQSTARTAQERDIANAQLISAAPELLAALETVLALAEIPYGNLDPDANEAFDAARAAIAKAKGEA